VLDLQQVNFRGTPKTVERQEILAPAPPQANSPAARHGMLARRLIAMIFNFRYEYQVPKSSLIGTKPGSNRRDAGTILP
jgi:hypothetical protein